MVQIRPRLVALGAMYAALSVVFCWPLFAEPNALGVHDWDQHLFYYGAVLKNVIEYGQAPFWSPWYCGGNVLWQNPQVGLLSPVYPLAMLMPLQLAMKVNIVLHYFVGFTGMHWLLTRGVGLTFLPAVVYLATLFTASGAFAIHLAVGHSVFLPGFYLPFQLAFVIRAFQTGSVRSILAAAALLALMVVNGGVHILPMAFAAIGVLALAAAALRREWRPLMLTVVFGVAALSYAAPKLLPVTLFVSGERFWDTRNPTEHPDRATLEMVVRTYVNPDQDLRATLDQQRHGWHEYGNYIGPFSAGVLVLGLVWALVVPPKKGTVPFFAGSPKKGTVPFFGGDVWLGRALAVTALFLFALSLGEFSAWAPASLARHVPLFSSFRIPSRYTMVFLLFGAAALGWVLRNLALETRPRAVQGAVALACVLAAAQIVVVNRAQLTGVFKVAPFDTTFRWMEGPGAVTTDGESNAYTPNSPMLRALTEDRLFFYCYESLQTFRTALPDRPLVYTDGLSDLIATRFSPNRIEFSVRAGTKPSRVLLNQNWSPGWTTDAGVLDASSRETMASVVIAPGQSGTYAFAFFPPGLWLGTGLFLAACAASVGLWGRRL